MVAVLWSKGADQDLQEIHRYISEDSIRYANREGAKIYNEQGNLKTFPNLAR